MSGPPPDTTEEPGRRGRPGDAADAPGDDEVDEESEESFPASDAPQHWAGPPER